MQAGMKRGLRGGYCRIAERWSRKLRLADILVALEMMVSIG
jgi:hypothetical protein